MANLEDQNIKEEWKSDRKSTVLAKNKCLAMWSGEVGCTWK